MGVAAVPMAYEVTVAAVPVLCRELSSFEEEVTQAAQSTAAAETAAAEDTTVVQFNLSRGARGQHGGRRVGWGFFGGRRSGGGADCRDTEPVACGSDWGAWRGRSDRCAERRRECRGGSGAIEALRGARRWTPYSSEESVRGCAGYDLNKALAIPNAELERLGVDHGLVTGGQSSAYSAFAKTGAPLTWDAMQQIETQALIRGGMEPGMARATVPQAIQALKDAGVSGPTRIPWGGR